MEVEKMDDIKTSELRRFEAIANDLSLIELEPLEGAFDIMGEVPPNLQNRLQEHFPDDRRFRNLFGRYLITALDSVLVKRPDIELRADILEDNRKMMEGGIEGKLPWLVAPAYLKLAVDVLGEYFQKINIRMAYIAINNADQFKDKRGRKVYIDFSKLFDHPEVSKLVDVALQKITYKLIEKFKSPGGKEYLKKLPLEGKKRIRDQSLSYWIMDFDRELTDNEVILWIRCVIDYAKARSPQR